MQQNFLELDDSYTGGGISPSAFYTMMDETDINTLPVDEDLSDLHEDGLAASTEAFTLALTLMNYRDKIVAQNGLGLMEVTSIEQHVPGLLRYSAPQPFTYETSNVNMQWSLEAIDGKIAKFLEAASAAFKKIITWVIEKAKAFGARLQSGRMEKLITRIRTLVAKKTTLLAPSEVRRILGDDVYNEQVLKPLNFEQLNNALKSDISADDLNALRTGSTITDLLNILSNKKAVVPKGFASMKAVMQLTKVTRADINKAGTTLTVADNFFSPDDEGGGAYTVNRSIVNDGMTANKQSNENTLASVVHLSNGTSEDVRFMKQFYKDVEYGMAKAESDLLAFMSRVKKEAPNNAGAYKQQREQMYDFLRGIQEQVNVINKCMYLQGMLLSFTGAVIVSHTKENVQKLKGQTNG